ncbi:MAG: homogentisate phytyltransferase [Bacteroidota bacterium]
MWKAFLHFTRPHTIIGTTLSVAGLYLIALAWVGDVPAQLGRLAWALVACLGANIYIVGLNQLTDVDIDRINKPYLPLASGAFSMQTGRLLIGVSLAIALAVALWQGPFLAWTVGLSVLIGTLYSLPPVRLKRFHFWAAACIFVVRGVLVNGLLFLHFQYELAGLTSIPLHVWALMAFVFGMSIVIAWFKDIPDAEGDSRFQIATLTLRLGPDLVFKLGLYLLLVCYAGMTVAGLIGMPGVNGPALAGSHLALGLALFLASRRVDPKQHSEVTRFYLFVWGLFFLEYIVFAVTCWL